MERCDLYYVVVKIYNKACVSFKSFVSLCKTSALVEVTVYSGMILANIV